MKFFGFGVFVLVCFCLSVYYKVCDILFHIYGTVCLLENSPVYSFKHLMFSSRIAVVTVFICPHGGACETTEPGTHPGYRSILATVTSDFRFQPVLLTITRTAIFQEPEI